MSFIAVRDHLLHMGVPARDPVSANDIARLEARHHVQIPGDLKEAFLQMDGADHSTEPGGSWIRFWPLGEWLPAVGSSWGAVNLDPTQANATPLPAGSFVLADYGYGCVAYAAVLDVRSSFYGRVFALGATAAVEVAGSFNEFIGLVLHDDARLHSYY